MYTAKNVLMKVNVMTVKLAMTVLLLQKYGVRIKQIGVVEIKKKDVIKILMKIVHTDIVNIMAGKMLN